jgi:hypothetical protein
MPAIRILSVLMPLLAAEPTVTILPLTGLAERLPPAALAKATFHWRANGSLAEDEKVFVHVRDATGKTVFQADHGPGVVTSTAEWRGDITYTRTIGLPEQVADGTYELIAGLYGKHGRLPLLAGDGVTAVGDHAFRIGTLVVDHAAAPPDPDTAGPKTLQLDGYRLVFNEEFDQPLDVSPWGPGTRWIAHTPWRGDFGDAAFADPQPGFPFTTVHGVQRIEARRDAAYKAGDQWRRPWRAGLLASNDPKGRGFSLQYGYFEMKAKLPTAPGAWPAFWLATSADKTDPKAEADVGIEIDVIEAYGFPTAYCQTVHVWKPEPHRAVDAVITTRPGEVGDGFHTYGVLVSPQWITTYHDGVEVWRTKTPPEHKRPLMLLVNLALGGGWPINRVPNPSYMDIDYVRAYAAP